MSGVIRYSAVRNPKSAMKRLAWGLMLGLLALYLVGAALGWAGYASWHVLLVIVAILLLYNVMSARSAR
jgi:hypothetical protein